MKEMRNLHFHVNKSLAGSQERMVYFFLNSGKPLRHLLKSGLFRRALRESSGFHSAGSHLKRPSSSVGKSTGCFPLLGFLSPPVIRKSLCFLWILVITHIPKQFPAAAACASQENWNLTAPNMHMHTHAHTLTTLAHVHAHTRVHMHTYLSDIWKPQVFLRQGEISGYGLSLKHEQLLFVVYCTKVLNKSFYWTKVFLFLNHKLSFFQQTPVLSCFLTSLSGQQSKHYHFYFMARIWWPLVPQQCQARGSFAFLERHVMPYLGRYPESPVPPTSPPLWLQKYRSFIVWKSYKMTITYQIPSFLLLILSQNLAISKSERIQFKVSDTGVFQSSWRSSEIMMGTIWKGKGMEETP